MKPVIKPKLPKWIIVFLPFKEEEAALTRFIVPFVIFTFMGMWAIWYEPYGSLSPFIAFLLTILTLALFIITIYWLVVQVDILRILRLRLEVHYRIVEEDEEEKLKTKKMLSELCVNV